MSVLIVDDSLTIRMDLLETLQAAGLQAEACDTVATARAALHAGRFSLLILDVLLPDGDGIDLLGEIRERVPAQDMPVMLLSTEAEVQHRVRGLTTGADEYIGKPYDPSYVVARARELMARRDSAPVTAPVSVLVIDGDVDFRERLRQALEAASYRVLVAGSGEAGLRLAAAERPGAVLLDGALPGMDGAMVIRRIRLDAALRRVPCVLLTASEDFGAEVGALDAGADACVRKAEDMQVVLARLHAVMRSAGAAANAATASLMGPRKVLAVDDDEAFLRDLVATLRQDRYDVVAARSGEEALELLAVQPVDCVLLDLMMPGIGGHETCRRIKEVPVTRDIPVVMLTALEGQAAMIEGLSAGADDYIVKSGDFGLIRARVLAQIRRKQFEDENRMVRKQMLRAELEAAEARAARELAETRATLVAELERKNRELEAFSYSISHDLRAPLRSIDGFSQALLEDCGDVLDDVGRRHLNRVCAAARRMGRLIDDLLQLSKLGRAVLRRQNVDLSALARAVVAELQAGSPERVVQVRVADGLVADADEGLMRAMLDNLLGNAWKFTSTTPAAAISFDAEASGGQCVFCVRDNGVGFDMEYAGKLFAPFQRLHSEEEFPGTGIGLATVHRIVDRHGGRIWAESGVGEGTRFFWTLGRRREGAM